MAVSLEQFGLDQLSVEDRLELLRLIWESVATPIPPVPEWHWQELQRRQIAADANPNAGVPWEAFRAAWVEPT